MLNVFSAFNGCGGLWLALDALGVPVRKRYVSEIDKYANAVQMYRCPDTIQLGDITKIRGEDLGGIDLLAGGSPCQGFSRAGKRKGFNDPRSKLFFDFVRLLDEVKPAYFLLENVCMPKDDVNIISSYLGVSPIEINSALFSAQNRRRLYWTNIPLQELPKDKGLIISDILDDRLADGHHANKPLKLCNVNPSGKGQNGNVYSVYGKSPTLTTNKGEGVKIGVKCVGAANIKGRDSLKRVYSIKGKSPCLTTMQGGHQEPKIAIYEIHWRKLTPLECERLQTIPDDYTLVPFGNRYMSNSQRYKMLGNGWTIEVIKFLLKNMIFV